jgi:beta-lactamase class A
LVTLIHIYLSLEIKKIVFMKNIILILSLFINTLSFSQNMTIPDYLQHDPSLSEALNKIVTERSLNRSFNVGDDGEEQISFAVIDLTGATPLIGGVNMDNFIYPASFYKIYVAAEILNQVSNGEISLYNPIVVASPNNVDKSREIKSDPRPLLQDGDTVTINYLLDLMITRSDNSAANSLIDIAGRERINETLRSFNWFGSEVTRKYLKRSLEAPGYSDVPGTMTCALHAADFFYLLYTEKLVNPFVSRHLKSFLARQLDINKLSLGLPETAVFYHKSGWWSYWTNDAGLVEDGAIKYIIALFLPLREADAREEFKAIGKEVHKLFIR